MHELSVTQNILEIVLRHAETAQAQRITHIYLVIGQLSSFVDDSIQMYWDIVSQDTIAVGATLHFQRLPAQLQCRHCQTTYSPDGQDLVCPTCGGVNIQVVGGDEFYIEAIDVETDSA